MEQGACYPGVLWDRTSRSVHSHRSAHPVEGHDSRKTLVSRCKLFDVRSAFTIPQRSSLDARQYRNVQGCLRFPLLLIIDFYPSTSRVSLCSGVFTRTRLATSCEALRMLLFESLLFDFNPVFYVLGVILPFISPFSKYSGMINSATPYTYPGKHIHTYIYVLIVVVVLHVLK